MTATPLDPRMAQMQRSAQDAQNSALKIDALKKNLTPPKDKEKKLREACEGFESIFIQKMWEQMRATVPKSGLLKGREEQFWQGMFDQELSKKMSSSGGIGLADMMYDQLSRSLVSATRTTASDTTRKGEGFSITAAPLIPQAAPGGVQATAEARSVNRAQPVGAVQSVYTGEAVQPEAADAPTQPMAQNVAQKAADTATGAGAPAATTSASGQAAAAEQEPAATSPIVEQFLAELRSRQTAEAQSAPSTAHPAVPAQNVAPGAVTTVPQQAGVQQPQPNPVAMAQNVLQTAGSRMPAGGVLPPMTPVQRQPRVDRYQPTPNARRAGDRTQTTTETPAVSQAPQATAAGVGSSAAAVTAPAAAQQAVAVPVPATPTSAPAPTGPQVQGAAQENPAAPQVPQVVHSTFTTNVPPGRSGRRRPPRVPKGQALNRMPTAADAPRAQQPVHPQQAQQVPGPRQQPAAAVSAAAVPRTDGGTPNTVTPQG